MWNRNFSTHNTSVPGIILVINKAKSHSGEILLVNGSKLCAKGRSKNYFTDGHIAQIATLYLNWKVEDELSAIVTEEEVARNDYNFNPSRYVITDNGEPVLFLEEELVLLTQAEETRAEAEADADAVLDDVLARLGFGGW